MDFIPGVSQVKSVIQVSCGDVEGARKTQENFLVGCPVVSQVASAVEVTVLGNKAAARNRQAQFLQVLDSAINSVPLVGHIKGGIHYNLGNKEKAQEAISSANRSSAVFAGGVAGLLVDVFLSLKPGQTVTMFSGLFSGGPPGAILGGVAGGLAADGTYTFLESKALKEFKPVGTLALVNKIKKNQGNKSVAGDLVDLVGSFVLDGLTGATLVVPARCFHQTAVPKMGVLGTISDSVTGAIIEPSWCNLGDEEGKSKDKKNIYLKYTGTVNFGLRKMKSLGSLKTEEGFYSKKKLKRSLSCTW